MAKKTIIITESDYLEKKLEVAKHLLPTMVAQQTEEYMIDVRKRSSLIFNCVAISDHLLQEVGYKMRKTTPDATVTDVGNRTAIRKLSEMLDPESE